MNDFKAILSTLKSPHTSPYTQTSVIEAAVAYIDCLESKITELSNQRDQLQKRVTEMEEYIKEAQSDILINRKF